MVEYLKRLEWPELRKPVWVGAFIGWLDAQEGASRTIRYLVDQLHATRFAELDPEDFYDFTAVRPYAYNDKEGRRVIRWPYNELFYWSSPETETDLILFLGTEPSLKWRTYVETMMDVIESHGVEVVITLGSLMDAVPHTRDSLLSGNVNKEELKERLEGLRIMGGGYQGPVGITSVFTDACTKRGLDCLSLWGHAPHYVQRRANDKVVKALTDRLNRLLGLTVPLDELERRAQTFEAEVTKAISSSIEVSAYVKRLERQYDSAQEKGEQLPSPQAMVEEMEEFLKRKRSEGDQFSSN
ncbi:MAG: PAC2 family protein [Dehalococcoidia bacterium]